MSDRPLQSLSLRQAIVQRLRADANLTAIVADRTYGPRTPATLTWPWIRVNISVEGPLRKGTTVRATVHSFSKAQFDDECSAMNSAVQRSLENGVLDLDGGGKAFLTWLGSQVMPDSAEADAWHGLNSFDAAIG